MARGSSFVANESLGANKAIAAWRRAERDGDRGVAPLFSPSSEEGKLRSDCAPSYMRSEAEGPKEGGRRTLCLVDAMHGPSLHRISSAQGST